MWCSTLLARLVNIIPKTVVCVIHISYIELVNGGFKPTNILLGVAFFITGGCSEKII